MNSKRSDGVPALNIAGVGRICMWPGGSVWIGRNAGRTGVHAHHAVQITVCLRKDASVLFRSGGEPRWGAYGAAIVLPNREHAFDGCGCEVAHIFVEPESKLGRALVNRYSDAAVYAVETKNEAVDELARAWLSARADDSAILAAGQRVASAIAGNVPPGKGAGPKLCRALEFIAQHLPGSISLSRVASAIGVSPSRLRHLFVAEAGTTYRGYVLWLRINRAVAIAMAGNTWTQAAHEAGFTDSAHLSRTFRRVFGVSPAMLVQERD